MHDTRPDPPPAEETAMLRNRTLAQLEEDAKTLALEILCSEERDDRPRMDKADIQLCIAHHHANLARHHLQLAREEETTT